MVRVDLRCPEGKRVNVSMNDACPYMSALRWTGDLSVIFSLLPASHDTLQCMPSRPQGQTVEQRGHNNPSCSIYHCRYFLHVWILMGKGSDLSADSRFFGQDLFSVFWRCSIYWCFRLGVSVTVVFVYRDEIVRFCLLPSNSAALLRPPAESEGVTSAAQPVMKRSGRSNLHLCACVEALSSRSSVEAHLLPCVRVKYGGSPGSCCNDSRWMFMNDWLSIVSFCVRGGVEIKPGGVDWRKMCSLDLLIPQGNMKTLFAVVNQHKHPSFKVT